MTRHRIKKTLRRAYIALALVLILAFAAKMATHIPGVGNAPLDAMAKDVYDYLKDMALVFVTVVAAYLANVFQKRSKFVESLEEEWRNIVRTKSVLHSYFEKPYPTSDDHIAAFARVSETIDTMRIVYRNAGETKTLIGLYPYAPLHDMRRVLQAMDPRIKTSVTPAERKLAQDSILQCFYALRENFLEELDLEEPHHPLLISGGRRLKTSGQAIRATTRQNRQREAQNKSASANPEIDAHLGRLYAAEQSKSPAKTPSASKP
ncbi:MAG: hypothetical protein ABL901_11595 [Hyphomicrobiaceae bacterium]